MIEYFNSPKSGWLRIFGGGIEWKKANAKKTFSERIKIKKTVVVFGWRFGFLPRLSLPK